MLLTDPILEFQRARAAAAFQPPGALLLQGLSPAAGRGTRLRKTPGLATMEDAGEEYFTSIPFCLSKEDSAGRPTLICLRCSASTDKDSLIAFCQNTVHIHQEYLGF